MYGKGIPANINITLQHFKNMKASQPALFFSITANGKNPNLYPVQAMHEYIQLFKPIQGSLSNSCNNVCSFDDTKLWVSEECDYPQFSVIKTTYVITVYWFRP
jgi:hypothetical protein